MVLSVVDHAYIDGRQHYASGGRTNTQHNASGGGSGGGGGGGSGSAMPAMVRCSDTGMFFWQNDAAAVGVDTFILEWNDI